MPMTRRQLLRSASALSGLSLAGFGNLAALPINSTTMGTDLSEYRALVCVFLFGGLDNHDTVLPYDAASYGDYAAIRAELLNQYSFMSGGSTRLRDRLLPLSTARPFGGREFALTEEFSGIKGLYDAGNAALVTNVGPLLQPLDRTQFLAAAIAIPKRLFSHNDQQSTWVSSQPEGAQFGWGGRFSDQLLLAGANPIRPEFSAITTQAGNLFISGDATAPYQVGVRGAARLEALRALEGDQGTPTGDLRYTLMRQHFAAAGLSMDNLIHSDFGNAMEAALNTNELYDAALQAAGEIGIPFPAGNLGGQLRAVANTIAAREVLGVTRQIFFVGLGGFDTHSNQALELPNLQREIDAGVTAFFAAMQSLGLGQQVTLFTASDFGRTLAVNGDGTDHGWGGHHFVVGEAVNGGEIYGDLPPSLLDHDQDAGGGRLIPTLGVEQYAAALGRWYGLTDDALSSALDNLDALGGPASAPGFI